MPSSKKRFKVPRITTPATMYLVRWLDANHDDEYDGPSKDFDSALMTCSQIGFHTKTRPDHIVLAGGCDVQDGENHSRWHLTIPRVHILEMLELEVKDATRPDPAVPREPAPPAGGGTDDEAPRR